MFYEKPPDVNKVDIQTPADTQEDFGKESLTKEEVTKILKPNGSSTQERASVFIVLSL